MIHELRIIACRKQTIAGTNNVATNGRARDHRRQTLLSINFGIGFRINRHLHTQSSSRMILRRNTER